MNIKNKNKIETVQIIIQVTVQISSSDHNTSGKFDFGKKISKHSKIIRVKVLLVIRIKRTQQRKSSNLRSIFVLNLKNSFFQNTHRLRRRPCKDPHFLIFDCLYE